MPATAHVSPTGVKSNMRKGSPTMRSRTCATTMLGGVPMRVIIPPRIVAKASGMSDSEAARFAFFAASMSRLISTTSAATLLMTADSAAPTPDMMPI